MKDAFWDLENHANVRLVHLEPLGHVIVSVEVTPKNRGKGVMSRLFDQVMAEADAEGVTLYLAIEPDGTGLDDEALDAFYGRRGFVPYGRDEHTRVRLPRVTSDV